MDAMPPIGAFLRPTGAVCRFGYCMRVTDVFGADGHHGRPGIAYERWGIKDGRPFDDGHVDRGHSTYLLATDDPGVWRDPMPLLPQDKTCYRLMDTDSRGQLELFG